MDPRKILFSMSEPRHPPPDPKNQGLGCAGCLFEYQRAHVCRIASEEAIKRGMADCDMPDLDGKYVVYMRVAVDPRQEDLFKEDGNVE